MLLALTTRYQDQQIKGLLATDLYESKSYAMVRRTPEIKARFEQGVAMLQIGQYQHAITAFHRVLALNPILPEAHVNMGFAFYELHNYFGAERFFRGALALTSSLPNAYYGLALSLVAQNKYQAAQSAVQRYLHSVPENDPFRSKALALQARLILH